ncbi:hypothetical protein LSM04_001482 [Trypanosoma melophagium]|uniref:uncharacterized protein n=1 Tax=Trypanosoma melophagium TaxID=715481 RepID=UPI003519EAC8|nr:hypothetical protein LSM04_001482 [Trypanosoma melophagium]
MAPVETLRFSPATLFHVSRPSSEGHLVQRKPTGFFQLKLYGSTEQWMGDTGDVARSGRTLALQWDDAFDAMSVRSGRNSYLTCRRGWVFYTLRTDATPSELWRPQYFPDGTFALLSLATKRYLRVRKNRLYCDAESSRDAAKFEGLNTMAVQSVCSTVDSVSESDAVAAACWSVMGKRSATDKVVLFGTLKPLRRLGPANESDMYDSFIIAKRTLTNWARLPGVKPVVMADDPLNHQLIEEINAVHAGRPDYSRIDIISEFEMHPKFYQPTYRGLFQKAISTYPSAKAVMYANMDILFTSSLARTVDKVRRVYETRKKTKPSLKGWFVVGRRTNVSVPANWSMDGGRWESRMETELQSAGTLYTATAQDYFIMNPELFNWTEIPPFVVGGVVFDNWLTSLGVVMGEKGEALTVDGTKSLTALHQKHADKTLSSSKPKSFYNLRLMLSCSKLMSRIFTTFCPYYTVEWRGGRDVALLRRSRIPGKWKMPIIRLRRANRTRVSCDHRDVVTPS